MRRFFPFRRWSKTETDVSAAPPSEGTGRIEQRGSTETVETDGDVEPLPLTQKQRCFADDYGGCMCVRVTAYVGVGAG